MKPNKIIAILILSCLFFSLFGSIVQAFSMPSFGGSSGGMGGFPLGGSSGIGDFGGIGGSEGGLSDFGIGDLGIGDFGNIGDLGGIGGSSGSIGGLSGETGNLGGGTQVPTSGSSPATGTGQSGGIQTSSGATESANTSIELQPPTKHETFGDLINAIINFLFTVSLALAPLLIIVGGFYFVTAAGDPSKIETGKRIILYTVIGLLIVMLAKGLIDFVISEIMK